ncbi:MAG: sodium/solute symporter [Gemmatimonadetes bacterium]|nr:sodium/solute symporter [Gemmatimonadota bacterium]MDA1102637.1 sodium/solute symporter [Gemmatimonadota bacterium]
MIAAVLPNLREYWLVHTLLVVYTIVLAHHAWTGNRKTKGLADYYVGGRQMGGWVIGLSFFATYASTNSFVGFSGMTYEWGLPWMLFVPTAVGFSLFAWIVVAPRLRRFTAEMGSLTLPDFIGFRFGSTAARVCAALIVIVASLFYMTAVFKGIGNLLETFLEIRYAVSIMIVFFIVMLYTMIGGFISVVKTDAVQGVVMIVAAFLLFGGTVQAAGGLGAILEVRDQPGGEALFTWGGGVAIPLLLGTMVSSLVKFVVEPRQLSRFFALEGDRAIRTGMIVSSVTFAAVFSVLIPIGMYARRVLGDGITDTDLVVPTLLTEVFGSGTGAFLVVAMVAAAMSSLDSVLLVMASTMERDVVSVLRPGRAEKAEMAWTKLWVALFALITAVIALNPPGGIVELTAFSGAVYGACFFPTIVLGLHWSRGSGASVLTSFAVGIFVLVAWPYVPGSEILHEVFPAMILSTLAYVGMSFVTADGADEGVRTLMAEASRR